MVRILSPFMCGQNLIPQAKHRPFFPGYGSCHFPLRWQPLCPSRGMRGGAIYRFPRKIAAFCVLHVSASQNITKIPHYLIIMWRSTHNYRGDDHSLDHDCGTYNYSRAYYNWRSYHYSCDYYSRSNHNGDDHAADNRCFIPGSVPHWFPPVQDFNILDTKWYCFSSFI